MKKSLLAIIFLFSIEGRVFGFSEAENEKIILYIQNKLELTSANLSFLMERRIQSSFFFALRDSAALRAPLNLAIYDSMFRATEAKRGFRKNRLKEISFVESYGKTNAGSYMNAVGIMQFTKGTGRGYGLKIDLAKGIDERFDPIKSIEAAGKYLSDLDHIFGQEDFANWGYHAGEGNIDSAIKFALQDFEGIYVNVDSSNARELIKKYELTVVKIYFGARPGMKLYDKINALGDYSMSYNFSLLAAQRLLQMSYSDYSELFWRYRNKENPDLKAPAIYYTRYHPDSITLFTESAMSKAVACGELCFLPLDDAPGKFCLAPEAAGMYFLITSLFKEASGRNSEAVKIISALQPIAEIDSCGMKNLEIASSGLSLKIAVPSDSLDRKWLSFVMRKLSEFQILSFTASKSEYKVVVLPKAGCKDIFISFLENECVLK